MTFIKNDGGRMAAGFTGDAGDCVCRAVAIAAERPYMEVYDKLSYINLKTRQTKRTKASTAGRKSARNGVYTKRKAFNDYMTELGFTWVPTMFVGQGCKVHLKADELPRGRLVVSVSRHMVAVIDGVINDTYDCTRGGTRCVYGYYVKG